MMLRTATAPERPAHRTAPPLVVELEPGLRAETAFRALSGLEHCVFFDSAMRHERLGRYSYVAADPFAWLEAPADGGAAIDRLAAASRSWQAERVEGLPPWQGGWAGLLGYEIGRSLERLPLPRWDEFQTPALAMGAYDVVLAFDHAERRGWAISHGLPERPGAARERRAECRLEQFLGCLRNGAGERVWTTNPIGPEQLAPQHATRRDGVTSDYTHDGYLAAVARVVEHLRAGDAYQVNLSQRLLARDPGDPVAMYERLRAQNPAPFAAYLDGGAWQLASASPERFLRVEGRQVETRPIKGTRPLRDDASELSDSEKDRAENVMIVDLLRNDLSRVCEDDSIDVPTLFGLERYAHVQHLVSVVTGRLRAECGVDDLLRATLPGGSITGAPKVSAQQIIARIEPTARGAYCGAMAWIGYRNQHGAQAMDSSVLIRTLTRARGWVQASVGGGVVVQSDPAAEYEETWHKAAGLIDAVFPSPG